MGSTASVANICTISSSLPPPRTKASVSPPEMYNPAQKEMVRLVYSARNLADMDFFTKSDPFLTLSRPARGGNFYNQVRKTETINNNLNPNWKILYIPLSELCDRNFDTKLKIEVFDEDNTMNELIGDVHLSLNDMLSKAASGAPVQLTREPKRGKSRGDLYIKECIVENYSHRPASQEASRKASLLSQSGDYSCPDNAGYRRPSIPGFPPINSTVPPAANYNNPAANLGYPPAPNQSFPPSLNPGYPHVANPGIPSPVNPGYPPAANPGLYPPEANPPGYPPAHQAFQPPIFPQQPPAYPVSVSGQDQHYIPSYNFQHMGPPGQSYPVNSNIP